MADNSLFENIGGALAVGGCVLFSPMLRRWYNRWGATETECDERMPGDELTPFPRLMYTRAVYIKASPAQVWSWLAQIGQGRGGLYSYDGLENLIGCEMVSADHILSEHQTLQVGDSVRLGPPGYPLYKVVAVDPGRSLVLTAAAPATETVTTYHEPMPETYMVYHWVFGLREQADGTTRLVTRMRMDYHPATFGNWLMWRVLMEPINFVMERRMLLGIKARAEASVRSMGRPGLSAN